MEKSVSSSSAIELQDITRASYLGCEVLMMRSNGYVNISKMCKDNNKHMPHWFENKDNQQYIKFLMKQLGMKYDKLILDKTNLSNELRGRYAHRYVTDKVAQWISHDLAFKVSMIIDDYVNEENRRIIKQKDDKIDELNRKIDEMMRDTKQVLIDNKITHTKLDKVEVELKETHTELVEVRVDREEISHKLDVVTDMIDDLCINTVPTDKWNKFAIFKVDNQYKAVRCIRSAFDKHCKRSIPSDATCLYETELPNGIEYFSTFKEEYARNKCKTKNVVTVSYNNIKLNSSVSEEEFVNILHQHRKRIDEMINEQQLTN